MTFAETFRAKRPADYESMEAFIAFVRTIDTGRVTLSKNENGKAAMRFSDGSVHQLDSNGSAL